MCTRLGFSDFQVSLQWQPSGKPCLQDKVRLLLTTLSLPPEFPLGRYENGALFVFIPLFGCVP